MTPELLARNYRATQRILALISQRAAPEDVSPLVDGLEAEFSETLEPLLDELYRVALQGGLDGMPEDSTDEIVLWLLGKFSKNPEWTDDLQIALIDFLTAATRLGVSDGLALLGGPDPSALTNSQVLTAIRDRASTLASIGRSPSLVHTTVREAAVSILEAVVAGAVVLTAVAALARVRAPVRSVAVAATETLYGVNAGRLAAFSRNGITRVIVRVEANACERCSPYRNRTLTLPPSVQLPLHPFCRCVYVPDLSNWTPPKSWWTGA